MTKRTRTYWTPEREAVLRAGYGTAMPIDALARRLGCTEKAAYSRAYELGLRRDSVPFRLHKYTPEQFEFVRKHYSNMSNRTISVVSGVEINAIRKWRYKFGWHKSDRYKQECKEYTRTHTPAHRREKQKEYSRRYREKYPERVAESKRRYINKKHGLAEVEAASES